MAKLKIVKYKQDSSEQLTVVLNGYIRISTAGVLQVFDQPDYNQRANGTCLLALPSGEWLSAEVIK